MSSLRTPAGLKGIARISVRNAANALKAVSAGHLRNTANILKDMANIGGMTVTADPANVSGYGNSHGSIAISTNPTTASAVGGSGPFTYAWTTGGATSAVSPTSATTIFRALNVSPGDHVDDTATCTVTPTVGSPAISNTVFITLDNYGT